MKTASILIADDHEVVRRGMRALLESNGWVVCGEASNGREAVEMAARLRPEIAVLDLTMPEMNGIEAARRISREMPAVEVLILTVHNNEEMMRQALAAGARGYVFKSDAGTLLLKAVRSLADHQPFFSPEVHDLVVREKPGARDGKDGKDWKRQPLSMRERLSGREREILQLLAEGRSNKEIATRLRISVRTVETHRTHIMQKVNAHSMSELVRYAVRNGLVAG